jgi:hypothetical protein
MPRPSDRKLHRGSRVMAQAPEPAILTRRSVFVTTGVTGTSAAQQDNENLTLNSSSQLHQVTAAALREAAARALPNMHLSSLTRPSLVKPL